jgi:hypothetical protein
VREAERRNREDRLIRREGDEESASGRTASALASGHRLTYNGDPAQFSIVVTDLGGRLPSHWFEVDNANSGFAGEDRREQEQVQGSGGAEERGSEGQRSRGADGSSLSYDLCCANHLPHGWVHIVVGERMGC